MCVCVCVNVSVDVLALVQVVLIVLHSKRETVCSFFFLLGGECCDSLSIPVCEGVDRGVDLKEVVRCVVPVEGGRREWRAQESAHGQTTRFCRSEAKTRRTAQQQKDVHAERRKQKSGEGNIKKQNSEFVSLFFFSPLRPSLVLFLIVCDALVGACGGHRGRSSCRQSPRAREGGSDQPHTQKRTRSTSTQTHQPLNRTHSHRGTHASLQQ